MRPLPQPGARMEAMLQLIQPVHTVAEIGADHGILSAHIVRQGLCKHIVVADISTASLQKAMRLFSYHGFSDAARFSNADGLNALDEPVDCIVIAGMGAETIVSILDNGVHLMGEAALILQANGRHHLLRHWLSKHGYVIKNERLVQEKRRFYVVIQGVRGEMHSSDEELYVGPCLLRERPPLWRAYLQWQIDCLSVSKRNENGQVMRWLEDALSQIDYVD